MSENFPISQKNTSPDDDAVISIRRKIKEANGGDNTIASKVTEVGDLKNKSKKDNKLKKKLEVNGESDSSNKIPRPPTPPKSGKESDPYLNNSNKKERSDDLPKRPRSEKDLDKKTGQLNKRHKKEKSERPNKEEVNKREALLSKMIIPNDPVIYDSTIDDLGKDGKGAWFYTGDSGIVVDKSGKGVDQRSKVKIEYKEPDGNVTEEKQVTWSELTPIYDSAEEYAQSLKKIRDTYEKAVAEKNTDYQKHLTLLLQQVSYFATGFILKAKEEIQSNIESQKDRSNKTVA